MRGIGGGHKRRYRMIDFQRLRYEEGAPPEPFTEKVINVRYDPCRRVRGAGSAPGPGSRAGRGPLFTAAGCPCRSADIALVAGGNRKRWIIATENMQPGDSITNSPHISRIAGARQGQGRLRRSCRGLVGCSLPDLSASVFQCQPAKGTHTRWGLFLSAR